MIGYYFSVLTGSVPYISQWSLHQYDEVNICCTCTLAGCLDRCLECGEERCIALPFCRERYQARNPIAYPHDC